MKPFSVLIVEDETLVREGILAYLEDEGIQATAVESGEAAVELLKTGARFDTCLMDMRLTGMRGDQAIVALHEVQPTLRFIVHTGSVDYSPSPELQRVGVTPDVVLAKPLPDLAVLVTLLRRVMTPRP